MFFLRTGEVTRRRMAVARLVGTDLCLVLISIVACYNEIIAFSMTASFAALVIRICKLDPEPFFLISLHTLISCLMIHDKLQTLAVLVVVALTCLSAGSVRLTRERIAVFVLSMASSCLLGPVLFVISTVSLICVIIIIKFRPLHLSKNFVLGLLVVAASLWFHKHAAAATSILMALVLTARSLFKRFRSKNEEEELIEGYYNNNYDSKNNNSSLSLMDGGKIKMVNTTESLDLHGHTVTEALRLLLQFLREHEDLYRINRTGHTRFVKVITGENKKNHPEDSLNLIKPTVANFLKINKYRYQVNPDRPGIIKIDLESQLK